MGYQVYRIHKDFDGYRFAGYGVPAICEYPDCNEEIDRGMAHACGGEPNSERGCDRYFCEKHLIFHGFNLNGERQYLFVCERCDKYKDPYPYKPETKEWLEHILTDESWEIWRNDEKEKVEEYKKQLEVLRNK